MAEKIHKMSISGTEYKLARLNSHVTTNTLTGINLSNTFTYANLAAATTFSITGNINVGERVYLICKASAAFTQTISGSNIKTNFNGKIPFNSGETKMFEITKGADNNYLIYVTA